MEILTKIVHLNQLHNSMSRGSLLAYKTARKSCFGCATLPAISESSPCICPCMLFTFICELILQNYSDIGFLPAPSSSSLFLSEFCMQKLGCHAHHVSCLVYLDAGLLYLISQFPVHCISFGYAVQSGFLRFCKFLNYVFFLSSCY